MSHKDDVHKYVRGVIDGEIVAGRWLRMACERYLSDLDRAEDEGWVLDEDIASRAIDFMEQLEHTKGQWAGKKFRLSPLQKFIVWQLLGWQKADGLRRFIAVYITVARKWGKSTFAAALALVLVFFDTPIEPEAEGYVAATKEEQAARIVTQADKMIQANPVLKQISRSFKYRNTVKSIVMEGPPYNGSFLQPIGADGSTTDGLNPHFVIKDELHEWKEHHRDLKEKLETGGGSRSQPVDVTITTSGSDQSTVWIEQDEYCQKVLDSSSQGDCIDETTLVIICRVDEPRNCECGGVDLNCKTCRQKCDCGRSPACNQCEGSGYFSNGVIQGDDPLDEANWPKANPDIGVTPSWEYMRQMATKAKHSPGFLAAFKRYHANIKIRSSSKIIEPKAWARCAGRLSKWSGNSRGGWDVGLRDDLASIAVCAEIDGRYEFRHLSFVPEDGPRDLTKPPWPKFIADGRLIVTSGDTTDFALLRKYIVEWSEEFGVADWAFDRAHSRQLASELIDDHGIECVEFAQTYSMFNEPMRELVKQVRDQGVLHDGDALLSWAVGNLVARIGSAGEWRPDKLKSPEKIDPIVAAIMAFARATLAEKPKKSVYARRGVIYG